MLTDWLPVLLQNAGITNRDTQRLYTFANSLTAFSGAMLGTAIVDHVGRRALMLWGSGSCGLNMAICAGLLSNIYGNPARNRAGIAFLSAFLPLFFLRFLRLTGLCLVLHLVFFSIGWTPLQSLYPYELISYENRQKAAALRGLVNILINCFNSFACVE